MLGAPGELNLALDEREEGVVLATTDVLAGVDMGAVLADENLAGLHGLTVITLGAQTLAARVATVAGGTETFFVCHVRYLLSKTLR